MRMRRMRTPNNQELEHLNHVADPFVCLTAHWLDENWAYRHALLDIYLCTDRHTGENLRGWIIQIMKDNDISVCCSHLNSFSVVTMLVFIFFILSVTEIGCISHHA